MKPRGPGVSGPAFHGPSHWTRPGGDLPTGAPKRHASRALRHGQSEAGVGGRKPSSRSCSLPYRVKNGVPDTPCVMAAEPVPPRMTGPGVMRSLSPATCSLSLPPTMREVPEISAGSRNIRVPPQANSPRKYRSAPSVKCPSALQNGQSVCTNRSPILFAVIHRPHGLCASVADSKHLADGLNVSGLTPSGDARRFQGPKRSDLCAGQ